VFPNGTGGGSALLTTKREGDLLWNDGNVVVEGSLPTTGKNGVVYHLINSTMPEYKDGYYEYKNEWVVNVDEYFHKNINGEDGYYMISGVDSTGKIMYNKFSRDTGTPNASNVWIDNSAYSYDRLLSLVTKSWLSMYWVVTYDEKTPIKCVIKSQTKWEGE
jgi:hypothetical protein